MVDTQNLINQNLQLARELKQRIDQLAAIGTVATTVSQSLDLDLTLSTSLQAVLDVVGAEAGGISLIDETAGEVVLRAQRGWAQDFVSNPMRVPINRGMSGRVISTDNVVVNNHLDQTEPLAVPSFHNEQFRSIAMAPMHARGKIIGILSIMSSRPYRFSDENIEVLRAIADTVGVALDNARLYETSLEDQLRLSAVLHSSADGIIATDLHGRIQLINQTAEQLLGLSGESLLGEPLREASIHPNIRNSLLYSLSSNGENNNKTFRVSLDDDRMVSVLISPIYVDTQVEQDVSNDGWVLVLQDVTHLYQAEIARTRFIQAAAHDMRNPLGVTINAIDMLKHMIGQDEKYTEILDIAMIGVQRIQILIDDLLNLEHIESGYGSNLQEMHIGEVINEVVAEIRPSFDDKQIMLSIEIQPNLPLLYIDRRWIVRAIMNYLDNAYKYGFHGMQVVLRVFLNKPMLHVEVADNGPGIPFEIQPRLFERFYRASPDGDIPGTGLGLAIVKSVAETHGGSAYVQSRPGQGSIFGFTLLVSALVGE